MKALAIDFNPSSMQGPVPRFVDRVPR